VRNGTVTAGPAEGTSLDRLVGIMRSSDNPADAPKPPGRALVVGQGQALVE
jgi:hypothetical protein